jgi:hypothetical protein
MSVNCTVVTNRHHYWHRHFPNCRCRHPRCRRSRCRLGILDLESNVFRGEAQKVTPELFSPGVVLHSVLVSFRDNVSAERREQILAEYKQLGAACGGRGEGILFWQAGWNLDQRKSWHIVEFAIFQDRAALQRFRSHPAHTKLSDIMQPCGDWAVGTLKSNKNDPGLPVMSCNAGISTAQRTAEEDATVGVEARFRHAKLDGVLPTRRERCAPDRAAALRLRQPIASPPPCGMETAQCRAWDSSSPLLRLPSAARSPDALL